eukprot:jgi/Chrzof1/9703/Cz04g12220.t1
MPSSLIKWENSVSMKEHYFNSLKEACFICKGSEGSSAVLRLASSVKDELWHSCERADSSTFQQGMNSLKVSPTARQGNGPYVPVRLFLCKPNPAGKVLQGLLPGRRFH